MSVKEPYRDPFLQWTELPDVPDEEFETSGEQTLVTAQKVSEQFQKNPIGGDRERQTQFSEIELVGDDVEVELRFINREKPPLPQTPVKKSKKRQLPPLPPIDFLSCLEISDPLYSNERVLPISAKASPVKQVKKRKKTSSPFPAARVKNDLQPWEFLEIKPENSNTTVSAGKTDPVLPPAASTSIVPTTFKPVEPAKQQEEESSPSIQKKDPKLEKAAELVRKGSFFVDAMREVGYSRKKKNYSRPFERQLRHELYVRGINPPPPPPKTKPDNEELANQALKLMTQKKLTAVEAVKELAPALNDAEKEKLRSRIYQQARNNNIPLITSNSKKSDAKKDQVIQALNKNPGIPWKQIAKISNIRYLTLRNIARAEGYAEPEQMQPIESNTASWKRKQADPS